MKTTPFLLATILSGLVSHLHAQPIVVDFQPPEISNEDYGTFVTPFTIVFGKTKPEDPLVDPNHVGYGTIEVTLTQTDDPSKEDWSLFTDLVDSEVTEETVTLHMELYHTGYEYWNAEWNGTWTVSVRESRLRTFPDENNQILSLPAIEFGTFTVDMDSDFAPSVTLRGRLWFEEGGTVSLVDEGPEVDTPVKEWSMLFDRILRDGEVAEHLMYVETDELGYYQVDGLIPGTYHVYPGDFSPLIGTQSVGDPNRDNAKDGFMEVVVTPDMDGQELVVNMAFFEEMNLPNTSFDDFETIIGARDVILDVLANDVGEDLRITGFNRFTPIGDYNSDSIETFYGSEVWTNGQVVYFTPATLGWDLFWYEITDSDGNIDRDRVWVYIDYLTSEPLQAIKDIRYVPMNEPYYDIEVLDNDILRPPHTLDSVVVSTESDSSSEGGGLRVWQGIVKYTPPGGFVGTDTFTYILTSKGETSSVEVEIEVVSIQNDGPPRNFALWNSLAEVVQSSPTGAYYFSLFYKSLPEILVILGDSDFSFMPAKTWVVPFADQLEDSVLDMLEAMFTESVSLYLAGEGDSVVFPEFVASAIEDGLETLETAGSPTLRKNIMELRNSIGSIEDLGGKSFNEIFEEALDVKPTDIFVPLVGASLNGAELSLRTFHSVGQDFVLWKASSPVGTDWTQIPQDNPEVDGIFLILKDPNAATDPGFYRVTNAPDPAMMSAAKWPF